MIAAITTAPTQQDGVDVDHGHILPEMTMPRPNRTGGILGGGGGI